ncbi:GFA family protein [Novosphingobium guangzhouense]|uniref:Aldehyde-activating protein n=1 Tax=Novosphingobium guangzhouense TaxID=1850347 RepID=A0A2K2FVB8_9SPHN|nr:GFA family protein [Novosphingobium guangzhouense]PNU02708.1 aldehyde-activating protein [Novosphingobium guangzhouense]
MKFDGGCQCGAVRYCVEGEPQHVSFCHCTDCQKSSGAPTVAWAAFAADDFVVTAGQASSYSSNGDAIRHFCPTCGSGLYYINEAVLPGLVDIQVATLDTPDALQPQAHIQTAERIGWMAQATGLPEFERYPG